MTFLQPLGLLLLLLLPLIVLLHMLKVRRLVLHVPTTYFWQRALRDIREQPRLQRPPITLLLILHLLIATLAALALGRPLVQGVLAGGDYRASHLLVVVDASASMQATDVSPSRLQLAKTAIDNRLAGLDPGTTVTLISAGVVPRILYAGDDMAFARTALADMRASSGSASIREAVRLATSLVRPAMVNRLLLVSDRTASPDQADLKSLGTLPLSIETLSVGQPAPNHAVTLVSARPAAGSANRYQLLARVANFSEEPFATNVRLAADGVQIEARAIRVGAGSQVDMRWDLPPGATRAEVRINGDDALPIDDSAQLVLPTQISRRLVLVSEKPDTLRRVFAVVPSTEVVVQAPKAYLPDPSAAVTVFENFLPEAYPPGALVMVNPPRDNRLFPSAGESANTAISRLQPGSHLLEAVDLSNVAITLAQQMKLPVWANEVIGAEAGPLLFEGTYRNTALAVFTFNLADSNLPSRVAFPILMTNLINYLAPEVLPPIVDPGQPVTFRGSPQANQVTIRRPDGATAHYGANLTIVYADTDQAGRYTITEVLPGGQNRERSFAVNAGDDAESDLRATRDFQAIGLETGESTVGQSRGREIWPFLAALALGLLCLEWWVAHR